MPAPKGHEPYTGCEKGGQFGYLGKPQDAYTKEELIELGREMLDWFSDNPKKIWFKDFFLYRGIHVNHINYLKNKYPEFGELYDMAKSIQEGRLNEQPFWKKADGAHARFMLARHHDYKEDNKDNVTIIYSKEQRDFISDNIKNQSKNNVGNSSAH